MKLWQQDNDMEMHSAHIEGQSFLAKRIVTTLKKKIYKYMNSILRNLYIHKLDYIFNEYNNTYHTTIKMMLTNVKFSIYIDFGRVNNEKDSEFKVDDHVRISKYENIFSKGYAQNWCEGDFAIKKVKNTVPWINILDNLNGQEIVGTLCEKRLQKQIRV